MRNITAIMLLTQALQRNPGATAFDLAHAVYAELDPYDEAPEEIKTLARAQLHFLARHVTVSRYRIGDAVLEKAGAHVKKGLQ